MKLEYFNTISDKGVLPVSVLELKQLEDVVDFSVRKEKMALPRKNGSNKGMFICFLNTSPEGIIRVLSNDHPMLVNQSTAYKGYYYDFIRLRTAIKSPRIKNPGKTKADLKVERISDYGVIQSNIKNVLTPKSISILAGKNFIYDMEPLTRLLKFQEKLKKIPLLERFKLYFKSIGALYDSLQFSDYEKGPIFINLDEYNPNCLLSHFSFYDLMMIMLKKSDNVIDKIMAEVPEMNILFYTEKGYMLINTKEDFKRANYSKLLNFTKRIKPNLMGAEEKYDKVIKADFDEKINMRMNLTGNIDLGDEDVSGDDKTTIAADMVAKKVELVKDKEADTEEEKAEEKKRLKDESQKIITDDNTDEDEEEAIDDTIDEIDKDEALKTAYIKSITDKKRGSKSEASLKRDALLRERQMKIKMHGKPIGELVVEMPDPPVIPEVKIETQTTDNEELKNVKFYNFEKAYIDECYDRDMARALTCFNDKGINVNVTDIKVEDTSTEMVYQDTYTVEFEDENRKRHSIKVNIPKLVDDKFLIINGKKRVIEKQLVGLPVIKTGPDEVQIVTNYNKLWISRVGTRFNPNMERFKKVVTDKDKQPENTTIRIYKGDNSIINRPYITCLEYDELASKFNKIIINDCTFVFSVDMLKDELGDKYQDGTLDKIIIGYRGKQKTPIVYDTKNTDHQDMVSLIVQESMPNYYDEFKHLSSGRKYVHNNMTIMEKVVPVVFIISFFEGLTSVVQKFNILDDSNQVEFVDTKSNTDNYMYIQFSDGYLRYPMNNLAACVLFNGFTELVLKDFSIADMDDRDTYIEIFERLLGSGYFAGGFINYYDFMIDYKTLDILKLLHYPEDIVSLIIYASNLLADSSFSIDTDPKLYRLRDVEIIPAILYKELTKAYGRYRKTANNANPVKISVDPDCVIKTLNRLPTVDSYSTLSPIVEVKQFGVTSMKGHMGMNKDRAYNEEKRNYHDNMVGIIGISTDISGNCGKERHLVVEPNVVNAYGMLDVKGRENVNEMDATKLMTTEEMTYPMGVAHDDPNRTAMTSKQSCHAIPVMDQCPCLITNGFDSTIQYRTSNDFSYVAKQDGEVIDKDDDANIMVIKYKDGTVQAIDLDEKTVQNGGGGFYLQNKLDTTFKKGDKFKKDAILAFDRHYYKDTGVLGNKLTYGTLVKSACLSNMATYEDSTWSTYRISRAMSTDITMKEISVVIGKNSNIDFIVKKGDKVHNGDDLIRFDTAYSDAEMNEFLKDIRADLKEDIVNLGKSKYTTKHDGIVAEIRVYPAVDRSEMSASLRKFVDDVQSHEKKRRKFMDKYDNNKNSVYRKGIYFTDSVETMQVDQYGKIGGVDVHDGVLVEIYVKYHDEISDGDKFAHMSANKATNGYMIPRGFEPYSLFRPYEEIDIPLAPSAILQRGTPSIITVMTGYKVLIELKRSLFETLTGIKWNEKQRKDRPYMDVHTKKVTTESVSESSTMSGFDEAKIAMVSERMDVLESVFDIGKSSDGRYEAAKEYSKGDIVLSGLNFKDELNRSIFESRLATSEEGYDINIELDTSLNAYVAKDVIFYGERLVCS